MIFDCISSAERFNDYRRIHASPIKKKWWDTAILPELFVSRRDAVNNDAPIEVT